MFSQVEFEEETKETKGEVSVYEVLILPGEL